MDFDLELLENYINVCNALDKKGIKYERELNKYVLCIGASHRYDDEDFGHIYIELNDNKYIDIYIYYNGCEIEILDNWKNNVEYKNSDDIISFECTSSRNDITNYILEKLKEYIF